MKNIHLIPTEKPSRVYKHLGRELKHTVRYFEQKGLLCINQHIYITSDEFIEEGDWMYYKHFGEDIVCKYDTMNGQNTNVNEHKPFYQKIILTTNQDLIADGVQAIDEEFLEWLVKNPSCEFVEVERGFLSFTGWVKYKIVIPQEEPKQETLEEAARRYTESTPDNDPVRIFSFIEGAKWQADRRYSEEEVLEILEHHTSYLQTFISQYVDRNDMEENEEWFEQFKKK
jgi:hypothetical protein